MMRSLYRLRFLHTFYVGSRQSTDQFHEAGIVRITNGGLAIWLHPFGMLEPQVVVNLLPKLAIGVDLVRHGDVNVFPAFTLSFGKFWPVWQKSLRTTARALLPKLPPTRKATAR